MTNILIFKILNLPFRRLKRIIQEIIESEEIYIQNMKQGIIDYVQLFDTKKIPEALVGKRQIIFSNIEVICDFHEQQFLPALLKCNFDPVLVAETFTFFVETNNFDAYIFYVINRKKSEKICIEQSYFFRQAQKDNLGIGSFLLKPVQRLPRYTLLLAEMIKDLIKDLDNNKAAIAACCAAEKKIQKLLSIVNAFCE